MNSEKVGKFDAVKHSIVIICKIISVDVLIKVHPKKSTSWTVNGIVVEELTYCYLYIEFKMGEGKRVCVSKTVNYYHQTC